MKLSEYAKKHGITYRTAFRWWQNGQIKGFQKPSGTIIVVEHQERATRFGFRYLEVLLSQAGRTIEVANLAESNREDLLQDLSSIVYSMCARLYGQRRAKRNQVLIGKILADGEGGEVKTEP